jgi:3-carboxy-cis,cis-muconate cycloisomerase
MNYLTLQNQCFAGLFADEAVAQEFGTTATLGRFLAFEIALTRALAGASVVKQATATAAVDQMHSFHPDLAAIARATPVDGLPVPEFVRQLKSHVGADLAQAVHSGATSQDLIDTAMVLALKELNQLLEARLKQVIATLAALTAAQGDNALMARTRMQAALPITVAERIKTWQLPLETHLERLGQLRPRLERMQFGGAVGDRAVPAGAGDAVALQMARALGLLHADKAWHSMRDGVAEYAGWLSLVTGTLGKMGQDICLMAQQGIGEIRLSGTGSSSAMPHKQNPVQAEMLVSFARYNAVQLGGMHQALIHEQERSGAAWTLEWMILPAMLTATARALSGADDLLKNVERIGAKPSDP